MSKRDPAFLFYSKDWLEGTAEMLPAEKGVYIDLLAHQHQKGDLPNSTERLARIVGISHDEFLVLWGELSSKFTPNEQPNADRTLNRLVNLKLQEVMGERAEKGKRNSIIGTFAAVLRKEDLSKKQYTYIKSQFKIEDFEHIVSERLTECLTEWLHERLKSIEDENENKDTYKDNIDIETKFENFWKFYERKGSKQEAKKLFLKLTDDELEKIKVHVKAYKEATPERKFRKDAERYLSNRLWENEDAQYLVKPVEYWTNPFEYWNRDLTPEEWKFVPPDRVQAKKDNDVKRRMGI